MASDESMTPCSSSVYSSMQDLDVDDYAHDERRPNHMYDDHGEGGEAAGDDHYMSLRMSHLSLDASEEGDDADSQVSEDDDDDEELEEAASDCTDDDDAADDGHDVIASDFAGSISCQLSLRGTPRRHPRPAGSSCFKENASQREAARCGHGGRACGTKGGCGSASYPYYYGRSGRIGQERPLDRAWEMKRCQWAGGDRPDSHSGGISPCVMVRPSDPGAGCMWMDMDEVKACRDLGLELPCDWTVEIPPAAFTAADAGSSGGDSSVDNWSISSPGEDPRDMKARLRVWAQAVALASASRLTN